MMLGRAKPLNAHGDRITGVVKKTFLGGSQNNYFDLNFLIFC